MPCGHCNRQISQSYNGNLEIKFGQFKKNCWSNLGEIWPLFHHKKKKKRVGTSIGEGCFLEEKWLTYHQKSNCMDPTPREITPEMEYLFPSPEGTTFK